VNLGAVLVLGALALKFMEDKAATAPPALPSCAIGEAPRWFGKEQIINGRKVGPGWVCLPVVITKL